jgi:dGTPase
VDAERQNDTPVTADSRSRAEHDCDRILYSDELRRLGGVTQVVAVGEMPLFHTRLTHTLKVQQLARRMAEHLTRDETNRSVITSLGGLDVSAAEAAGLAHDLGHPPFGHVGETALNEKCHAAGLDGYEGNAQTFRILTKLSRRGEDTRFGLDLSDVTLRAVIKYPWLRTGDYSEKSKWNAYPTERAIFDQVRGELPPAAVSPEAAIMDWADDITYAIHDLEDFIRAGRVPVVTLGRNETPGGDEPTPSEEFARFTSRAVERLAQKHKRVDWTQAVANFRDVLEGEFGQFYGHTGTANDLARLRSVSRRLIDNYVSAISLEDGPDPLVVPPLVRGEVELFKQLTWHYVIHDPALATLQEGHTDVVKGLFEDLMSWLKEAEKNATLFRLPKRLLDLYNVTATEEGQEAYHTKKSRRARAVADYIASLTETQAINLHERLRGAGAHSVLDRWVAY